MAGEHTLAEPRLKATLRFSIPTLPQPMNHPNINLLHLTDFGPDNILNVKVTPASSKVKLDLRIGKPMQICIHRKDNSPKPVNHHLTLKVKYNIR